MSTLKLLRHNSQPMYHFDLLFICLDWIESSEAKRCFCWIGTTKWIRQWPPSLNSTVNWVPIPHDWKYAVWSPWKVNIFIKSVKKFVCLVLLECVLYTKVVDYNPNSIFNSMFNKLWIMINMNCIWFEPQFYVFDIWNIILNKHISKHHISNRN